VCVVGKWVHLCIHTHTVYFCSSLIIENSLKKKLLYTYCYFKKQYAQPATKYSVIMNDIGTVLHNCEHCSCNHTTVQKCSFYDIFETFIVIRLQYTQVANVIFFSHPRVSYGFP